MPNSAIGVVVSPIEAFDEGVLPHEERRRSFARYLSTPSGREKPGRYWRVDLDAISVDNLAIGPERADVVFSGAPTRVTVVDLVTARREHAAGFARVFGTTRARTTKFGALAESFAHLGAFVHVPANLSVDEPIVVTYRVTAGSAAFPCTLVLLEDGARATVVERIEGGAAFVCGVSEIVTGTRSDLTYVAPHRPEPATQSIFTRSAQPGRDARMTWALADLGGALSMNDVDVTIEHPGAHAEVVSIFFPGGDEHVDVVSTIDHRAGDASSETVVKSAANGRGQARFLGNIRIAPHAQGSNAALRDDALLLSQHAHIDSVPALEIAANDVKAFHGATVGALDADQIFYMESRGIAPNDAERMIALGFFEPAIARFPGELLREELREALRAKLE
ncbi:MAG: Fe-S cluster assembly protein SufD [Vulcanimicrobiaceae bacterium]